MEAAAVGDHSRSAARRRTAAIRLRPSASPRPSPHQVPQQRPCVGGGGRSLRGALRRGGGSPNGRVRLSLCPPSLRPASPSSPWTGAGPSPSAFRLPRGAAVAGVCPLLHLCEVKVKRAEMTARRYCKSYLSEQKSTEVLHLMLKPYPLPHPLVFLEYFGILNNLPALMALNLLKRTLLRALCLTGGECGYASLVPWDEEDEEFSKIPRKETQRRERMSTSQMGFLKSQLKKAIGHRKAIVDFCIGDIPGRGYPCQSYRDSSVFVQGTAFRL
ncbi:uncharacterized protein LOC129205703 isoform X2 [Grus americana]|uniref:uncharacterized protein LOC129205703 isoform X2 n=1 Tax=Grus americana TaxID=9117 RepID=UPI002407C2A7|nr:uncharacterized protein LOC129205703 isoform X2 [Grus americana]